MNEFIKNGLKEAAKTVSGNGSLKYSTSLNTFVDDFASIGTYMNRSYEEVSETMQREWSIDPNLSMRMIGYIRTITRKETHVYKTKSVQRGQGLRNEYYNRMLWLATEHPECFYENLPVLVELGSPRDLFELLRRDYLRNGWDNRQLNWNKMYDVIRNLIFGSPSTVDLVLKFLPTPRTNKKATTDHARTNNVIARWLAWKLKISMSQYKALKRRGNAHKWQQHISRGDYQEIDFSQVSSGALSTFTHPRMKVHKLRKRHGKKVLCAFTGDGTTFLERHGLEDKYLDWIESQDTVNSTEFPHVVLKDLQNLKRHVPRVTEVTINKKFDKLLETAKDGVDTNSRFIAVRDTSGSMGAEVPGMKFSADHVAKSMALFMSQFLEGPFKDAYIEFNSQATMRRFEGNSHVAKYMNDNHHYIGSTNFLDVARIFVHAKEDGVPESEMPTGIVCFSDGEFDPSNRWGIPRDHKSNFHLFLDTLRNAGFSQEFVDNFKIILWDIPNGYYEEKPKVKFEDSADTPNFFYIGGFDPSVISFLMGGTYEEKPKVAPRSAEELMQAALYQEILDKLVV